MLDSALLPLTDGRLRLRPLLSQDATAYAEGTTDPDVRAYAHLPEPHYTTESVTELADTAVPQGLARGDLAVLTITASQSDQFGGSLVIFDVTEETAEVGFWLHPDARGHGLAGSALELAARFAAGSGLSALTARTVPDNLASQRVLTRAGFVPVGKCVGATPSGEQRELLHYRRPLVPASVDLDWDVTWHAGHPSPEQDPAPAIQTHWLREDTAVLRQNKSVHFEAPFLFLLFGRERALLVDTGATAEPERFPLRSTVERLVAQHWQDQVPAGYELLVVHTHGHGDHRAADGQFTDRPDTVLVGHTLEDVVTHYGFADWPATPRILELGERTVDVIPAPGHHPSATAFYDRDTGLLLTGDSLYPGRLYVQDWAQFVDSVDRLVAWAGEHPVSYAVGCHIERSAAGQDYPQGTTHQPEEAPLQLPVSALIDLQAALRAIDGQPGRHESGAFAIWYED